MDWPSRALAPTDSLQRCPIGGRSRGWITRSRDRPRARRRPSARRRDRRCCHRHGHRPSSRHQHLRHLRRHHRLPLHHHHRPWPEPGRQPPRSPTRSIASCEAPWGPPSRYHPPASATGSMIPVEGTTAGHRIGSGVAVARHPRLSCYFSAFFTGSGTSATGAKLSPALTAALGKVNPYDAMQLISRWVP